MDRDPDIMKSTMEAVGADCRKLRHEKGLRLKDVAQETGYAVETIQSFERGRNRNVLILLWYLKNGLQLKWGD